MPTLKFPLGGGVDLLPEVDDMQWDDDDDAAWTARKRRCILVVVWFIAETATGNSLSSFNDLVWS